MGANFQSKLKEMQRQEKAKQKRAKREARHAAKRNGEKQVTSSSE
ncbi:MAG TPA: hypothetical protein VIW67_10405 [Terriglobales bacterium]